jgi:aminoglycoside phosphotransferase family enzyme
MCYKACVRAKVSLFGARDLNKNNKSDHDRKRKEQAEEEATRHLQLAESYLELL